jgi:hypothetical protein
MSRQLKHNLRAAPVCLAYPPGSIEYREAVIARPVVRLALAVARVLRPFSHRPSCQMPTLPRPVLRPCQLPDIAPVRQAEVKPA